LEEYNWLLKEDAFKVFRRIKNILSDCCTKLPLSVKTGVSHAHTQVEKYTLTSQVPVHTSTRSCARRYSARYSYEQAARRACSARKYLLSEQNPDHKTFACRACSW
uniref:Uncharacterized protein n=1 Tax=Romanomermis culicivorax TaxID=13658 RepID=A0A915KDV5_ROMCU